MFKKADVDLRRSFIGMCARGVTGCAVPAVAELLGKPTTPLYYVCIIVYQIIMKLVIDVEFNIEPQVPMANLLLLN